MKQYARWITNQEKIIKEEIDEENREYFEEAGGESFAYIPALNAEPVHLDALTQLIEDNLQG